MPKTCAPLRLAGVSIVPVPTSKMPQPQAQARAEFVETAARHAPSSTALVKVFMIFSHEIGKLRKPVRERRARCRQKLRRAYPLSALGVRARGKPNDSITLLAGVFNGSPANKSGDNFSGTGFPMDGGVLAIGEIQYAYPSLGSMVSADSSTALSGTYKLGFWYDSENFVDLRYDSTGASLADNTGNPALMHHGDYGIYAVADQMLWHSDDLEDRTFNAFARVMGTPQADRNLVDFSMNAGFTLHEPIPLRDNDTVGIGVGYAHVSNRASGMDQDTAVLNPGTYTPVRSGETFVEATYQYQVMPWWQVQPDIQYVFNPGAGAVDNNGQRIKNEAIIGLRTNISF